MNNQPFIQQLESIIVDFNGMRQRSRVDDLSDLPKSERQALVTRGIAAIHRIGGANSIYILEVKRLLDYLPNLHAHTTSIMGVANALLIDVKAGYLQTIAELIHADAFSDFLDMARHLQDTGYKDAAAVITGSTLEMHLRNLCNKTGIAIEVAKPAGGNAPKKADALNSELAAANVYSKLDQKQVTAWLDLRNKAAHGKYEDYDATQVSLYIDSVKNFLGRNPA